MIKNLPRNLLIFNLFFLNGCGGQINKRNSIPPSSINPSSPNSPSLSNFANQILEYIYTLCEQSGYDETHPFCLTHNLRNIRQIIKPYLYKIKEYYSDDLVFFTVNEILAEDLKISHFYFQKNTSQKIYSSPFEYCFAVNSPSKTFIERNYVIFKITDFKNNFNFRGISPGIFHAFTYKKGIIIDLRDNMGGNVSNLHALFACFFAPDTVVSHKINRKHELFLEPLENWIGNYSNWKMKNLINTLQSKGQVTHNLSGYSNINLNISFEKNIAVLINENSASCSEHFTMALKDHFPNRVKIIGKRSHGSLLTSLCKPIHHLGLKLTYPIGEIIGIHGTRVEGVGIEPDVKAYNETQIMLSAIEWVTDHN